MTKKNGGYMGKVEAVLHIERKVRNGWYVYTCAKLPGLYVASQEDRRAFEDLPRAVQQLIKLDEGLDVTVTMRLAYADFLQFMHIRERAQEAVTARTDSMMRDGIDLVLEAGPPSDGVGTYS